MFLTIAIPTYNRPTKVCERISELIPQICNNIEILVVDNASDEIVEAVVGKRFGEELWQVRFHRNVANVGLCGNICRCYEISSGEWVWTVGDDDEIAPNAVEKILSALENTPPDLVGVNFSTSIWSYKNSSMIDTLSEYWEVTSNPKAFSNALFISSCVFNRVHFLSHLRIAYQLNFSAAPHIAFVLTALGRGLRVKFSDQLIANHKNADEGSGWNWIAVFSAIPVLAELPGDSVTQRGLTGPLNAFAPGLRIREGIKLLFLERSRGAGFWYIYYSRMVPCLRGYPKLKALIFRFTAGLLFQFPALKNVGVNLLALAGYESYDGSTGLNRL